MTQSWDELLHEVWTPHRSAGVRLSLSEQEGQWVIIAEPYPCDILPLPPLTVPNHPSLTFALDLNGDENGQELAEKLDKVCSEALTEWHSRYEWREREAPPPNPSAEGASISRVNREDRA